MSTLEKSNTLIEDDEEEKEEEEKAEDQVNRKEWMFTLIISAIEV